MPLSFEQFTKRLTSSGVMSEEQLRESLAGIEADAAARADGERLARELVRQKKLTAYQAQQIYAGKGKSLVLGNYTILDKLGQGGMGMVLKAEHRRMKRLVAIKILSPAAVKSPEALQRFHREVEAAARLEHPHIVPAYDADEAGGTHFFVMQYVEGKDLSALVKQQGPLSPDKAVNCILQAARGLEFAHGKGVIHRDIKPANLLLDSDGTVKILDMGLARLESSIDTPQQAELTSTGQIMGTVDYMAPEQALSTKTADARSDIYSLGITLWYLLTGRAAYDGDTLMAKLLAHREAPIPSLVREVPGTSAELEAVFQKMVAKKPAERYQSMSDVLSDLARCLSSNSSPLSTGGSSPPSSSEDTKLSQFLRGISARSGEPTVNVSQTAVATESRPTEEFATIDVNPSSIDTDPQTQRTLGAVSLQVKPARQVRSSPPWWSHRKVHLVAAAGGAAILLAGIVFFLNLGGKYNVQITLDDPSITLSVDGNILNINDGQGIIKLSAGEHKLKLEKDGLSTHVDEFTVTKDGKTALTAKIVNGQLDALLNGERAAPSIAGAAATLSPNALNDGATPAPADATPAHQTNLPLGTIELLQWLPAARQGILQLGGGPGTGGAHLFFGKLMCPASTRSNTNCGARQEVRVRS